MIHREPLPVATTRDFVVRVGHHTVRVSGEHAQDAISAARKQLCDELPRMWDLIHQLRPADFTVDEVPSATRTLTPPQ